VVTAEIRVATWNLWWRFGPWKARAAGIEATLRGFDADIVCLQEVWSADGVDQAAKLAEALGYHHLSGVRAGEDAQLGNAVLSRWPIADGAVTALPLPNGQPGYRSLVRARVESPAGLIDAYSTHLDYRFDHADVRSRQLSAVSETIAADRATSAVRFPPILCGDLNATPQSDEIRMLTGAAPAATEGLVFTDAWAAVGRGPGYTWDERNPHLARSTWPRRRLDYVLVAWPRDKPQGNPLRARLAGARPHEGVWPSDHLAVVVDLAAGDAA